MKKNTSNYSLGTALLTLASVLCLLSFFLPLVSGEFAVGIQDTLTGKSVGETVVLPRLGIYGVISLITVYVPLAVIFVLSVLPFDRIKKYVFTCFLCIILLIGFLLVYYMLGAKVDGAAGTGFYAGLLLIASLFAAALVSISKDPAARKDKAVAWYNVLNKIVLLVCLPLAAALLVFSLMMFKLISNLPVFISVGVFLLVIGTMIAAAVSILAVFGKYAFGRLYFLTGICWAAGIVFCLMNAGIAALIASVLTGAIFGIFWLSLARISRVYF